MNLQNGKFYETNKGVAVKAQLEADNDIHCYDVNGREVHVCKASAHVEGWSPVGRAVYQKAREKSKQRPAPAKKQEAAKESKKKG